MSNEKKDSPPPAPKPGDPPEVLQAWAKYWADRQPDIKDLIRR